MKRSEMWRLDYRVRRYLSYVEDEELDQRLRDIWSNLATMNAEGQIELPPLKGDLPFPWMEIWVHTVEEYRLRCIGMPSSIVREASLPKPPKAGPAKGTKELQELGLSAKVD